MNKYPKHRNPIAAALLKKTIIEDIERLKTDAGIHALNGESEFNIRKKVGRLLFIVICAARHSEDIDLDDPDLSVIRGAANALGDLGEDQDVERHRMSIVSGINAASRFAQKLSKDALVSGELVIRAMLASPHGLTVADFDFKK
jgi:hypothetical protein